MTEKYYKFDVGKLSDDLYRPEVPVEKWLATCESTKEDSFPEGSLNSVIPITWDVELERIVGISLYMAGNVFPFLILPFTGLYALAPNTRFYIHCICTYVAVLAVVQYLVFYPWLRIKYKQVESSATDNIMRSSQYAPTERNTTKYLSMSFVWPKSLHRPAMESTPLIYCIVPHAAAPFGVTAYPLWSKLFNSKLCRWTAAPIVLKIPVVGDLIKKIGYIPAKSKYILETLTKKEQNVGIILDGIAGMFHQSHHEERAYLKKRKKIVQIALQTGTPIVPVYGFGHTSMYTVVVDPFGFLEKLSNVCGASLTPFFGRFGWFLGPPRRTPVVVCLGDPVKCPKIESPSQEEIDEYHSKMLDAFQTVFETHKAAYGWSNKTLKIV